MPGRAELSAQRRNQQRAAHAARPARMHGCAAGEVCCRFQAQAIANVGSCGELLKLERQNS